MTEGKVAVVTGGSRGIGRSISRQLASAGHSVAVNYATRPEAAEEVVDEIRAGGGTAVAVGADVSAESDVAALFDQVAAELGQPTVLVNNAGITLDNLMIRMSADEFDRVIAINLRSAFLCSKVALRPMLKARWGRIVSIASVSALQGNSGQANYAASKAGLVGLSKSLAKEVGRRGITSNVVAPGFIQTDMTDALGEDVREGALAAITLGRFGTAEEVAALVAFLVSDAAGYITGQVIGVDGGISL